MEYHPTFFTATCLEWKMLLKPFQFKEIICNSLKFLVEDNRVKLYAFVIIDNHLHLIWKIQNGHLKERVQMSFLKYTAQQMKFDLLQTNPKFLQEFKVQAKDREYQFWERNALSIELSNEKIFEQKLDYIHENPVKAGICKYPEDYEFSSAKFYMNQEKKFTFITHYKD